MPQRMMRSSPKPGDLRPERRAPRRPPATPASPPKTVTTRRLRSISMTRGEELPRVRDRVVLEVVAEAEVAEHLEERVVPRGDADVLEVVVLAADADALLAATSRACTARWSLPVKTSLNWTMPGVREHQRRIVRRHDRPRGDDPVISLAEVAEKRLSNLAGSHARFLARADRRGDGADSVRAALYSPAAPVVDTFTYTFGEAPACAPHFEPSS